MASPVLLLVFVVLGVAFPLISSNYYRDHGARDEERCPLLCRCLIYRSRFSNIHSWSGYYDKTGRWNVIQRKSSPRHVTRPSVITSSQKKMICMGLKTMPPNIPSGTTEISIMGDSPMVGRNYIAAVNDEINHKWNRFSTFLNNRLSTVNRQAFKNAKYVTKLTISNNHISVLKEGDFQFLSNLQDLDLNSNQIRIVTPKSFLGLSRLDRLRLSDNNIKSLPETVFEFTPKLKSLFLTNNEITFLSRFLFSKLSRLNILDLSNNRLSILGDNVFRYNTKLIELSLNGNHLKNVRPFWFVSLKYLQKLRLGNNSIKFIGKESFRGLASLKELSLASNKLDLIHRHAFRGLDNLRVLDLSDNVLTGLGNGALIDLPGLIKLNLATNRIREIGPILLKSQKNVETLDLSGNYIRSLSNSHLKSLVSLKKLDLSHNNIAMIKVGTFNGLMELRELYLSNNDISILERYCFSVARTKHLSKITWLTLQHNKITSLGVGALAGMPHLKYLSVSHNKVAKIDLNAFYLLANLRTLSLNHNQITYISRGMFKRVKHLRHLYLAGNRLRSLKLAPFSGLRALQELDVSSNSIAYIGNDAFVNIVHLNRLNISNNSLKHFDLASLLSMSQLAYLDLGKNDITSVKVLDNKSRLKYLSLAENRLTSLSSEILKIIRPFGEIDLRSNPWLCDCRLSWLRNLAANKRVTLIKGGELLCKYPLKLSGLKILSSDVTINACLIGRGDQKSTDLKRRVNEIVMHLTTSTTPSPRLPYSQFWSTRQHYANESAVITPTNTTIKSSNRPTKASPSISNESYYTQKQGSKISIDKSDTFQSSTVTSPRRIDYASTRNLATLYTRVSTKQKDISLSFATTKSQWNTSQGETYSHTRNRSFTISKTRTPTKLECRKPITKEAFKKRIIRKYKKDTKNYYVMIMGRKRRFACNGVLLSRRWVLTSANCVRQFAIASTKTAGMRIRLKIGERELNKAVGVSFHPKSRSHGWLYDFALLRMKYDSLMMHVLKPLCLYTRDHVTRTGIVPVAMATRIVNKKQRGRLRALFLTLDANRCVSSDDCLRVHGNQTSAVTAGAGLYVRSGNTWNLVGISTGSSSTHYTPIWLAMSWIDSVLT